MALVDAVIAAGGSPWVLLAMFLLVMLSEALRRVLTYRAMMRREAEHTRRFESAVAGTESCHRAEVVAASVTLQPKTRTL